MGHEKSLVSGSLEKLSLFSFQAHPLKKILETTLRAPLSEKGGKAFFKATLEGQGLVPSMDTTRGSTKPLNGSQPWILTEVLQRLCDITKAPRHGPTTPAKRVKDARKV